jgi:predicted kinase
MPGSGKSTIAGPLAAELGFTLIGKDPIKETLHDVLGPSLGAGHPPAQLSRQLGAAAMELLWALAADAPAAVLDANFWVDDERVPRRVRALSARPVEVYCACPPELAARRYLARSAGRHQVHAPAGQVLTAEMIAHSGRPLGTGEVITVDTTAPVDVAALAAAIRARLSPGRAGVSPP